MKSTAITINEERILYVMTTPRHLRAEVAHYLELHPRAEIRALADQLRYEHDALDEAELHQPEARHG